MCFSEQVSFTSAAVLTLMSAGCFKLVKDQPKLYALAAIPLFFGIQQASEGVEWLTFKEIWGTAEIALIAKYIFVFFAYCFWPSWLPLSLYLAEKEPFKKRLLGALSFLGLSFSIYVVTQIFLHGATAKVVHSSIQYDTPIHLNMLWMYMALVYLPWFISSLPRMATVGSAYAIASVIAGYNYVENFTSVWCFFAAIVSVFLIFALKKACEEFNSERTSTK